MNQPDEPIINPKRAVVGRSLRCRSCGYNLRGLRLDVRCPECGLPVKTTVDEAIDPAPHDLPALRNPRQLGNALLWLTVCMLLCAIMLALPPAMRALRQVEGWRDSPLLVLGPTELLLAAAGVALLGLRSAWVFAVHDRRGSDGTGLHRDGRLIGAGLLIIALSAASAWAIEQAASDIARTESRLTADQLWLRLGFAAGGGLLLVGLGRVLEDIGQRSREYREAQGGRQSTRVMILALSFIVLGTLGQLAAMARRVGPMQWIGEVVVLTCALMIVIGLSYLVLNAWWVRNALRRRPPRLRDIIRIEPDTTAMRASLHQSPPGRGGESR